jgi:hypothetical protein
MKIKIKETRILTLDVQIASGATKEQVTDEIKRRLTKLTLEFTRYAPTWGSFDLWVDDIMKHGNKLATCELSGEQETENREILSIDGQQ